MNDTPDWPKIVEGIEEADLVETRKRAERLLAWAPTHCPPESILQLLSRHAQKGHHQMDQRIQQFRLPAWKVYDHDGRVRTQWEALGKLCWLALALVHLSNEWQPSPPMANMLMGGLRLDQEHQMRQRIRQIENTTTRAYLLQWLQQEPFRKTFRWVAHQSPEQAGQALLRAQPQQRQVLGRDELTPILAAGSADARRVALRLCGQAAH